MYKFTKIIYQVKKVYYIKNNVGINMYTLVNSATFIGNQNNNQTISKCKQYCRCCSRTKMKYHIIIILSSCWYKCDQWTNLHVISSMSHKRDQMNSTDIIYYLINVPAWSRSVFYSQYLVRVISKSSSVYAIRMFQIVFRSALYSNIHNIIVVNSVTWKWTHGDL